MAFDLPIRTALGREDFFVSPANADAVAMIDGWRDWPSGALILVGPAGSGKTHLTHVWAASAGARIIQASDLPHLDLAALVTGPVAIEDADLISEIPGAAVALLHLFNLICAEEQELLIAAASPPMTWAADLADLSSRLQAIPMARLYAPDDSLLSAVLTKLFADRQISPSPDVTRFLARRIEPSFEVARQIVKRLDEEALMTGRAVTRGLVAKVLDKDTE